MPPERTLTFKVFANTNTHRITNLKYLQIRIHIELQIQMRCRMPATEKPLKYLQESFDAANQKSNTPQIEYQTRKIPH